MPIKKGDIMTKKTIDQIKENFYNLYENHLKHQREVFGREIHLDKRSLSVLFLDEVERYIGGSFDPNNSRRIFSTDEIVVLTYVHDLLNQLHDGKINQAQIYENLRRFDDNTQRFYQAVKDMDCGEYYRLSKEEKNINTSRYETTPLIEAIKKHHLTFVLDMVRCGVNVNQPDKKGRMPLYYALENNALLNGNDSTQAAIVQVLVQNAAKVDNLDGNGLGAMAWAVMNNRPRCLMFLAQRNGHVDGVVKDENGENLSFLNYALTHDFFNVFQVLISNGADVNAVDASGCSALMLAEKLKKNEFKNIIQQCAMARPVSLDNLNVSIVEKKRSLPDESSCVDEVCYLQNGPQKITRQISFGGNHKESYPIFFSRLRSD